MRDKGKPLIKSLARAFLILETINAQGEIGVRSLSEILKLPRSTVHRFLSSLELLSYLRQNPRTGNYRLSLKLLEFGMNVVDELGMREIARPVLEDLVRKTEEAAHLGTLDNDEVIYIDKVDSFQLLRTVAKVGSRAPMHCSGVGKVLLAFMPEGEREELLSKEELPRFTDRTITSVAALRKHLAKVQEQCWAMDNEEWNPGLISVAAPLRDHQGSVHFAISIAGPKARMKGEKLERIKELVCQAAKETSLSLGYSE